MKFRFMLGCLVLFAALVIGFGVNPAQAQAAVELSPTNRNNLQAVLNVTKVALDAVQMQINRDEVRNPQAMIATLGGVRSYLLSMQQFLSGVPVAAAPRAPIAPAPVASAPQSPADAADEELAPAAPSTVAQSPAQNRQTASVSASAASRWAFWIILLVAVVLAIVLALPRRQTAPHSEAPQANEKL